MKLLHTSDWHLGAKLHDASRHVEQEKFLNWLLALLRRESFDLLLITGDIFDTNAPSNQACGLYYSFLAKIYQERLCHQVVMIGGNHDSPSHLMSPKRVLKELNVEVFGEWNRDDPASHLVPLDGCVVCAVPYLRDRDLIRMKEAEDSELRTGRLRDGIRCLYETIVTEAEKRFPGLPLIVTGHLTLSGAQSSDRESERSLPVGTLEAVSRDFLPDAAYIALGHLHRPQEIGSPNIRYSGSPLPMSFSEADQKKTLAVAEWFAGEPLPHCSTIEIPSFQVLKNIRGDRESILLALQSLPSDSDCWLNLEHTGEEPWMAMEQECVKRTEGTALRILAMNDTVRIARALASLGTGIELKKLNVEDVFRMRMTDAGIPDAERETFLRMFQEICNTVIRGKERSE